MTKLIIAILLCSFTFQSSKSSEDSFVVIEENVGIHSNEKLKTYTFFNKMTILLPSDLIRLGEMSEENRFGMASLESKNKLVNITIRKKSPSDFELIKGTHESMAISMYKGEVVRSVYKTIDGEKVYIFEQNGFWNDSDIKETWIKFYCTVNNVMYQCLIKYPLDERHKVLNVMGKMINSLKID